MSQALPRGGGERLHHPVAVRVRGPQPVRHVRVHHVGSHPLTPFQRAPHGAVTIEN
ncbi:hypothetical protein ACQ4WX_11370 [Streptomyces lasalocidi]